MIRSFRDLLVYQKAFANSLEVHKISQSFPHYEQYELACQIRRATKSIAMNIAEGYGRNESLAEFRRFLTIALGSCDEVKVQLDYCKALAYITDEQYRLLEGEYVEISKMLVSMIKTRKHFQ